MIREGIVYKRGTKEFKQIQTELGKVFYDCIEERLSQAKEDVFQVYQGKSFSQLTEVERLFFLNEKVQEQWELVREVTVIKAENTEDRLLVVKEEFWLQEFWEEPLHYHWYIHLDNYKANVELCTTPADSHQVMFKVNGRMYGSFTEPSGKEKTL